MRAGPLSNKKVIDLLNAHFVPVYTVNEDYARLGELRSWRATLLDGDQTIAEQKSFLW